MAGEDNLLDHTESFFLRDVLVSWDATVRAAGLRGASSRWRARRAPARRSSAGDVKRDHHRREAAVAATRFLLEMLHTVTVLHAAPTCRDALEMRAGEQLEEATLEDMPATPLASSCRPAPSGELMDGGEGVASPRPLLSVRCCHAGLLLDANCRPRLWPRPVSGVAGARELLPSS